MNDLLHNLPVFWMTVVTFGFTYLIGAVIYIVVVLLAVGERARSFKTVSCCRRLASFSVFLLRLRLPRSGMITRGRILRSAARLAPFQQS